MKTYKIPLVSLSILAALILAMSLQAQSTPRTGRETIGYSTNLFDFPGGTLNDFVKAVKGVYGVDLLEMATVPDAYLSQIRVPKLKLKPHPVATPYTAALKLYNTLSSNGVKGLGKWFMDAYDGAETIVFVPPAADELDMSRRVRAFSIVARSESERNSMREVLLTALDFYYQVRRLEPEGSFRYHETTSILIAVGDDAYLNVVSEVVKALKETKP